MIMHNYAQITHNYGWGRPNIAKVDGSYYGLGSSRISKQYIKDFFRRGEKSAKIA